MKRKLSLLCAFVLVFSICATVTLNPSAQTQKKDVSHASVEVYRNPKDEVADMNDTTQKTTAASGSGIGDLLNGFGGIGSGFNVDIGSNDIINDAKDVITGIIGGSGSGNNNGGNSGSANGNSGSSNNPIYIDPVPAGTQYYQPSEVTSSEAVSESVTESQPSESVSVDESMGNIALDGLTGVTESDTLVTAPESIEVKTDGKDDDDSKLGIMIAIIAAIWCVAIIVIILVFVLKKKKSGKKGDADKELEFAYGAKKTDSSGSSDMSLSDLFEEANKD